MDRSDAISWVLTVCAGRLRLSQVKTPSILVASAVRVERVSLGNIGRRMLGRARHQLERCWRFVANERRAGRALVRHGGGGGGAAKRAEEAAAGEPGLGGREGVPRADGRGRAQGPLGPAVLGQLRGDDVLR